MAFEVDPEGRITFWLVKVVDMDRLPPILLSFLFTVSLSLFFLALPGGLWEFPTQGLNPGLRSESAES